MNHKMIALVLGLLVGSIALPVNLDVSNKLDNGTLIIDSTCNKDTQIDFFFSSDTLLKNDPGSFSLSQASKSTMKFLDVTGDDLDLTLKQATLTEQNLVEQYDTHSPLYFVLRFRTDDNEKRVDVIVPILQSSADQNSKIVSVNNFDNVYQTFNEEYQYDSTFEPLRKLTEAKLTSGFALSFFNFLNLRDFGHFFTVTSKDQKHTLLISDFLYNFDGNVTAINTTDLLSFSQKAYSGDKLCYGAQETENIFQTHLRQSYPLWTAWFAILFFWVYYLIAESHTNEVYDQHFQNNKMTCWGFYSIHYLAHEDCFTRLSRLSQMLFNFSFQGMVLAAVYSTLGPNSPPETDFSIIIWAAMIALFASLPIPFFLGGLFLNKIYKNTLQKYKIIKKSKNTAVNKKEQANIYEQEIDKKEETLYGLYYWFYIIVFAGFVSLWTASVHMMMQLHRDYYYLHWLWIASLGIVFFTEHLIFDPLLSVILGNTGCYRLRGYFYNFEMCQEYKDIEE